MNNTDTQVPEDLTLGEREQVIDQALILVEQLYVHLPLKRAMHAVDPIQRLRLLKYRLRKISERRFHDEMISIFMGLRDMHTLYTLPASFQERVAVLGFRIQRFFEFEGGEPSYMVTNVDTQIIDDPHYDPHFKKGVVVMHWNGVPVDRAVELNADRWAGSNPDARHAIGLATMTVRPMSLTAPPDEEWVTVGYLSEGQEYETRLPWNIDQPPPLPASARTPESASDPLALTLGISALVEAVQRTRKKLFRPEAMEIERQVTNLQARDVSEPDDTDLGLDMAETSTIPHALEFRTVSTPHGEFGYLRIYSFRVDPDAFVAEVVRIVRLLPQNGLIVDVRGNPGGRIPAGERLLQIFTPSKIEPERLHFICTPLTLKVCERYSPWVDWKESIGEAVETAAPFSDGFPVLPGEKERCNSLGQQYHGPAVLITDALCYSTTDFFAAGWQDHGIGYILGTDGNTGAGGANVVEHADLVEELLPGPDSPIRPLPKKTSLRVAIRRSTRVGKRLGDPLEDLGVVPDKRHYTTRNDLLRDNTDLIARAASILASLPVRALDAKVEPSDDGMVLVSATVANISRLDAYVDGRPRLTLDIEEDSTEFELPLDSPGSHELELRGFDDERQLVAARRIEF